MSTAFEEDQERVALRVPPNPSRETNPRGPSASGRISSSEQSTDSGAMSRPGQFYHRASETTAGPTSRPGTAESGIVLAGHQWPPSREAARTDRPSTRESVIDPHSPFKVQQGTSRSEGGNHRKRHGTTR